MRKVVLAFFIALAGALGGKLGADLYPMLASSEWSKIGAAYLHDHTLQAATLSVLLMTAGYVVGLRKFGFRLERADSTVMLGVGGLIIGKFTPMIWSFLDGTSQQFVSDFTESPYLNSWVFLLATWWIAASMIRAYNKPAVPI